MCLRKSTTHDICKMVETILFHFGEILYMNFVTVIPRD